MNAVRNLVLSIIGFFYKPFRRYIDEQTFRYLACGGSNVVLDTLLFAVFFHFVLPPYQHSILLPLQPHQLTQQIEWVITWAGFTAKTTNVAFAMAFAISCPVGFILSRYIVFPESTLKGRVQLFRYLLLVGACLLLNYYIFNLFVYLWPKYPTPSKILTTGIVAVFSYISQRTFTFKVRKESVLDATEPEVTDIYP